MSDITRRDVLRRLALTLTATGFVDRIAAQEVHLMTAQSAAQSGGMYPHKTFSEHEFRTLEALTDMIIPVENGAPGAVAANAAAWIDMISQENAQLKETYTRGLAWLDGAMKKRGAVDFLSASPAQRAELLDLIAYRRNETPELAPGIEFFTWARRMTVDAFYTSEIGIRDIDYRGNTGLASDPEPTEAIADALKRSGLG